MFWCREPGIKPTVRFVGTHGYWSAVCSPECSGDLSGYWAGPISGSFKFDDAAEREVDRFLVGDSDGVLHTVIETAEYDTLEDCTGEAPKAYEVKRRLKTPEGQDVCVMQNGAYTIYGIQPIICEKV